MMKKIIILLLFSINISPLFSQVLYDSLLNELYTKYPQEKIYAQLDKSYYNAGETVWFKAYIKPDNAIKQISTSLYAELINDKGAIIERKTMPILLSGGASNFQLPDSIGATKIYIRLYTSWMLNFDSTLLYTKPINVIVSEKEITKPSIVRYTLTFFPEGGDLVNNIESKIAFKTNDQNGKPFEIKGTIVNATGKLVSSFNSVHNGMGFIKMIPETGVQYKAIWQDPAGKQHETLLPKARNQAATLSLLKALDKINFTVNRSVDATDDMKEFVVLAQIQQQTVYAAKINLKTKTTVTAPIPTDSLPDGVMQVTLFNSASLPVAERVVFIINGNQYFITDLHIIEKNLTPKGRNVLQVDVGGKLKSNLSISVTDADLDMKPSATENIFSEMLLSSDLKGYIYNPSYYFSSDEDSVTNQLDLVMMTNGWRRFNWEKMLAGQMPVIKYIPENYLTVKGNVFGLSAMQMNNKMITGFLETSKQGEKSLFTSMLEKDGSFKIDQMYFFDTLKIYYQFNSDKNKKLTDMASFSLKSSLLPVQRTDTVALKSINFAAQPPKAFALKSIKQNDLYKEYLESKKIKVLESVTVTAKTVSLKEKLDKEYTSGLFSSGTARVFSTEDDPFAASAITVLDYLRSKVAGLQITTNGADGGSVTRRGSTTDLFLNEISADISLIQSTPMSDVAMIKVFDPPFFGSFGGGAGGAIAVYIKKGGSVKSDVKGLNVATVQGYSTYKEFYSPDYSTENKAFPDYRATLFWNPFLLMNAQNNRVTIPFYNNDSGKRLRVVIEGINELGQLSREEKIFE